jgi:hypothetical protein
MDLNMRMLLPGHPRRTHSRLRRAAPDRARVRETTGRNTDLRQCIDPPDRAAIGEDRSLTTATSRTSASCPSPPALRTFGRALTRLPG